MAEIGKYIDMSQFDGTDPETALDGERLVKLEDLLRQAEEPEQDLTWDDLVSSALDADDVDGSLVETDGGLVADDSDFDDDFGSGASGDDAADDDGGSLFDDFGLDLHAYEHVPGGSDLVVEDDPSSNDEFDSDSDFDQDFDLDEGTDFTDDIDF